MFHPTDLESLAARLRTAADVSEAKAAQHIAAGEPDIAERELNRAESARHYMAVCMHFAKKLTTKARAKVSEARFQPPTIEEVLFYVRATDACKGWPIADVQAWYDHFEANGWKVSGKTTMKCWKAAARNGARYWRKNNAKTAGPSAATAIASLAGEGDPQGWSEYLSTTLGREEIPYQYAQNWMKEAFRKHTGK